MNLDIISWIALALVVVAAGWVGIRMFRQRLEEQKYREELADLEFQQSVIGEIAPLTGEADSRFLQSSMEPALAVAASAEPLVPSTPGDAQNGLQAADDMAASVMQQLGAIGMVRAMDGYVPLHNNPKGVAILKLRSGKTALLVPRMESEGFLRANARRADIIIMAGSDGKAVVITPLEQFLAENI